MLGMSGARSKRSLLEDARLMERLDPISQQGGMTGETWLQHNSSRFCARPEDTELLLPFVMHGLQKMIALVVRRVLTVLSCADYTQL
jgi:hypothetical protein